MNKFDFLFGLVLAERLLQHTDNSSKTLQTSSLTASEGLEILKGSLLKQYCPKGMIKVVSNLEGFATGTCQNPPLVPSLKNSFTPIQASSTCGIGCFSHLKHHRESCFSSQCHLLLDSVHGHNNMNTGHVALLRTFEQLPHFEYQPCLQPNHNIALDTETYDNLLLVWGISHHISHYKEVTSLLDGFTNVLKDSSNHYDNCENFVLNLRTGVFVSFSFYHVFSCG